MKRIVALICSAVLALSVAPFASATTASAPVATGNVVGVTVDAPIFERESRKKCTNMCVQSTLRSSTGLAAYFVNDNTGLLTFHAEGIELLNLDNKESITIGYVDGFSTQHLLTAISNDQDEVYIYGTMGSDSDSPGRVFRIETLTMWGDATLSMVDVTPESPTYPLAGYKIRGLAVAPDNSGYYYIYRPGNTHRVCQFDETGVEVACSVEFGGASETSRIFMNYVGNLLFVMGEEDKRFAFDAANELSMFPAETIEELTGTDVNFEQGTQAGDGDMYFMDRYDPTRSPAVTNLYSIHMDGYLIDSIEIKGNFGLNDLVASPGVSWLFALGVGTNRRGNQNSYDSLYQFDTTSGEFSDQLSLRKHLAMSTRRDPSVNRLATDYQGRYVVALGEEGYPKVIPIGTVGIYPTTTAIDDNDETTVTWDYINLVRGTGATRFRIEYKAPGARKWLGVGSLPANGDRSFSYGPVAEDGKIRVIPIGVKMKYIGTSSVSAGWGG